MASTRQGLEPPAASEGGERSEAAAPKNRFGASVVSAAVVASVFEGSPAAAAGIEPGDVIEEAQGHAIVSGGELRERISATPAGEDLTLQLRRGGETLLRTVHLGDARTGEAGGRFGVTVESAVVVAEVFPGSPAAAAGLLTGDVIEDAHGQPVQSGEQLLSVLHALPEGAEVALIVSRGGERNELLAHLDRT